MSISACAGVFALALNLLVSIALTPMCDAFGIKRLDDTTKPEEYDEEAVELLTMNSGGPAR
ncbi:MAG: hypothetical protein P4L44_07330 [Oryzomonas sp.]|uniref:hypothetical protein n=1 Tax=Oryzomonas sp. TaxID=2855186 RepID=UPI00284C8947|nr:hypothetical protein [Oryzomonas sp.]MDR3579755.1 hypothetical protein [Oryzomonas sp.]